MTSASTADDFTEVPQTNNQKKRLIKSRVLSKLLHSFARGEISTAELPFMEEHKIFIQSLTGVQLSEFACMLTANYSVVINIDSDDEQDTSPISTGIKEAIAEYFIDEWILTCTNNYRMIYDEHSKGLSTGMLKNLIEATPYELGLYAKELAATKCISLEYDSVLFDRNVINAKQLFRQDTLIIKAMSSGSSLPQIRTLFGKHRLGHKHSAAIIKKIYSPSPNYNSMTPQVSDSILQEYITAESQFSEGTASKEVFLSTLYNLFTSEAKRSGVSFSDSWNVVTSSQESKHPRSQK